MDGWPVEKIVAVVITTILFYELRISLLCEEKISQNKHAVELG
jgi:hypothetical protein